MAPYVITFVPEMAQETPAAFDATPKPAAWRPPSTPSAGTKTVFSPASGIKENSREVLSGEGNRLEVFEDKPINFDAWDIDVFYTQKHETPELVQPVEVTACGALKATLHLYTATMLL